MGVTKMKSNKDDPTYENYMALAKAILSKEMKPITLPHLQDKDEADRRIQYLEENYYKKGDIPPLAKWYKSKKPISKTKITENERYHAKDPVLLKDTATGGEEIIEHRIDLCERFNVNLVTLSYFIKTEMLFLNRYIMYDLRENKIVKKPYQYKDCDVTLINTMTGEEKKYKNIKMACMENGIHYVMFQKYRYNHDNVKELKYKNFIFKNLPEVTYRK